MENENTRTSESEGLVETLNSRENQTKEESTFLRSMDNLVDHWHVGYLSSLLGMVGGNILVAANILDREHIEEMDRDYFGGRPYTLIENVAYLTGLAIGITEDVLILGSTALGATYAAWLVS